MINTETKIYGSFSTNPGNNGNVFFNNAFKKYGINSIYKSFYSNDIEKTIQSVKHLEFSGFALSSPHKVSILDFLDVIDNVVKEIGSCNTVVLNNDKLIGYNTDWIGIHQVLPESMTHLTIIGDGGFSKSVQYVCKRRNISFDIIRRTDFDKLNNIEGYVFNATPIEVSTTGILIDGRPTTTIGKQISKVQAIEQFKLYTGIEYYE
jgi:shikimate 5-dehydrogenase